MEILISKSIFLSLASLGKARQSISNSSSLFLAIIDSEVVLQELLGSVNLIKAQSFHIYKLAEVIMVSKNKDLQEPKICYHLSSGAKS